MSRFKIIYCTVLLIFSPIKLRFILHDGPGIFKDAFTASLISKSLELTSET
jgi:hypothetical protein